MSEVLKARLRVKTIQMGEPIATEDALSSAQFATNMPGTLRDDELLITEEDPEEDEIYSHENDTPEEVDFVGKGLTMSGSFIRATRAEMVAMMGGSVATEKYKHPSSKIQLEKSFKITCYDGSVVTIPRAKGYVNLGLSLGKGGVSKFPFKFKLQKAGPDWDCDIIF